MKFFEDYIYWYEKAIPFMLGLSILCLVSAVGIFVYEEKDRLQEQVIVSRFESLSEETYEGVANTFMDRWYGDLDFINLETENLEVEGIRSGVIAQIEDGKYLVITNQVIPEAYHSGPASLIFTEQGPTQK